MEREKLISLVTSAQAGDSGAMSDLFNAFYNDVYFFALKTCADEDTACEVTQETFIEIINTIGNLHEPAAFITWMKQIAYHQCTRFFKKQKSRSKYETLAEENEDGVSVLDFAAEDRQEFIPDEAVDQKEFRQVILDMLDQLSPEHRSAMMLYYYDELSVKDIAKIQCVSESAVKSRLFHGRKFIKKSVEDYEKKNNIKLRSVGLFPLFAWLFQGGGTLSGVALSAVVGAITVSTGVTIVISGTGVIAGAGVTVASGLAAFWASIPVVAKVVAAAVVVVTAVGGGTVAMTMQNTPEPTQPTVDAMASMPATTAFAETDPTQTTAWTTTPTETTVPETTPTESVTESTKATDSKETDPTETMPEDTAPTETDPTVTSPAETTVPVTEPTETTPTETTVPIEPTPPETTVPVTEPPETTVPETTPTTTPVVSGYTVPDGCTYTAADGTTYQPGEAVPEPATGDKLVTSDYTYTYQSSGWSVVVNDKTKTSYGTLLSEINGAKLTNMTTAFALCSSMKTAPEIPYGVTSLHGAFYGCGALTQTPDIPSSVISLNTAFSACSSLTQVSDIPSSVTDMTGTFANCKSLYGRIVINASPTAYDKCFASTEIVIILTGSSTVLAELAATASNGNVVVG